ncbi:acyltransferase family protein [Methylovorus mays]|uniref:acyltransferase family protein n=1 Tax=Methylovorus mays TaxID=184077 RepID=UPI001E54D6F4|nr:acyltransferase [Methylovorus mays]MCB5206101.1 acyltransferase [Methylovorus mays]
MDRFILMDGLRGIAALCVFIGHLTQHNGKFIFQSSPLAVDMFFCLSGFVIAWSYSKKITSGMSFKMFASKRLVRLYPMFLIGLFFGVVAYFVKKISTGTAISNSDMFNSLLLNSFYLPFISKNESLSLSGIFPLNPPSWSLFFELAANLMFFFFIRYSTKALLIIAAIIGALLTWYGLTIYPAPGWRDIHLIGGFLRVGFSFIVGVLIFRGYQHIPNFNINPWLMACVLMAMLLMPRSQAWFSFYWISMVVITIPLMVAISTKIAVDNTFTKTSFEYIGWLSYPLYCVHVPIIDLFKTFGINDSLVAKALVFTGAVTVAHLTGKYLDEPIRAAFGNKAKLLA